MATDWSGLPAHLLAMLAKRANPCAAELTRFAGVCSSWRSAASSSKPNAHIPFLLNPNLEANPSCQLVSPCFNTVHRVDLPSHATNTRCFGSSRGWLAMHDQRRDRPFLVNPITGAVVRLPRMDNKMREGDGWPSKICLSSSDPENDSDCILVMLQGFFFLRPAIDDEWSSMESMHHWGAQDVAYYEGMFYAVDAYGEVVSVDMDGDPEVTKVAPSVDHDLCCTNFLVVVPCRRLILIQRYGVNEVFIYETDFGDRSMEWVELRSLDDWTLFLGFNSAIALLSSKTAGVYEANSVCFPGHVYDLQDRKMRESEEYFVDSDALYWIEPNCMIRWN